VDKDEIKEIIVTFRNEADYKEYCRDFEGRARRRDDVIGCDVVLLYEDLKDGGVYKFGGELHRIVAEDKQHRQVDAKVFEHESILAVQSDIGEDAHVHQNVILKDHNSTREFDGIVQTRGENVPDSTAYIIEAQISPPLETIETLQNKINFFEKCCPSSPHFKNVTKVVPILAGKHWSKEVINACTAKGIWRVTPSAGNGYKIIRSLHTLLRKVIK
jgi:hypothetical protein